MAVPTVKRSGNFIEVSAITEDVLPGQIFGDDGMITKRNFRRIEFLGPAGDKCVLRHGSLTGPKAVTLDATTEKLTDRVYNVKLLDPYIEFSDGVYNTHTLLFELE